MPRTVAALAISLALLLPAARAAEEEPVFMQRKLSEWVKMVQDDPQPARRRAALLALQQLGPRHARVVVPAVAAALRGDADEQVRERAASVLGALAARANREGIDGFRQESVRESLTVALRGDRSGRVRASAAAALGRLKPEDAAAATPILAAALKDKNPGTRAAAADTLREMGPVAAEALPELQQALRDPAFEATTRALCARAVGRIGAPDAFPALPTLKDVLADPKTPADVRKAAAETLGLFGKDAAEYAGALGDALASPRSDVALRRAAAAALGAIGPEGKGALPPLKKALRDDDPFVRCHAMHALGGYGTELGANTRDVVAGLLGCLDDNVLEVRVAAIETLGTLGSDGLGDDTKVVTQRLTDATRDAQKAVREAAAAALKKLQGTP
jgi:HEAT repeat protein